MSDVRSFGFLCSVDHRELHVRTHSFPTRRSSDLDIPAPDCNLPHHHEGISCNKIRVDDAYAMENPVHIIGLGAVPANGPAMGSTIKSNPDLTLESTPDSRFIGLRPAIRVTETLPPDSVPALIYLGRAIGRAPV